MMEPARAKGDGRRPSGVEGTGKWRVVGRPTVPVTGAAFQRR